MPVCAFTYRRGVLHVMAKGLVPIGQQVSRRKSQVSFFQ